MKAVKEIVRKYYKYVSWTQPIMSSNIQNGITLSATNFNSNNLYILMNGVSDSDYICPTSTSSYGSTFTINLDYSIKLTQFIFNYYAKTNVTWGLGSLKVVAMVSGIEVDITPQNLPNDGGWNTGSSQVDDVITNCIKVYCSTTGDPYVRIGEITLQGDKVVDGTEQDYDFYKDTYEYSLPAKTERKYYKIAIPQYVQPTNPSGITATSGWSNPANAFDNNSSTYARCNSLTDYIEWDIGEDIYLTGVNTVGNWISGSAVATSFKIYSVDESGNETYIAKTTGAANTATYYTKVTFDGVIVNKLRFYITYTYSNAPSRTVQINLETEELIVEEPSDFQPEFIERKYYKYDMANPVSNVNITGTLTNNNGVLSGFSSSNYAKLPKVFSHGSNSWEVQFKVTTGSDVSTQGCICEQLYSSNYYGLTVYIQSGTLRVRCGNGSSIFWDVDTSYSISVNTTYWIKAEFNGTQYILSASIDGENWTTASTINSTTIATDNYSMNIGRRNYSTASPWNGSIDLKESYIKVNNELWWKGVTYPVIEGTEQDYDWYEDVYNYDFYRDINTYKAIKSYEKGQYYGN